MLSKVFLFTIVFLVTGTAHAKGMEGGKATSLKGEVIDLTCYAGHDAKGKKHADCAKTCLGKGLPAAILADGELYLALGANHKNASSQLQKFGGEMVKVDGLVVEKNGAKFIEIAKVEKL